MKIAFVSGNENKIREAREILVPLGFEPIFHPVDCCETGITFTENAIIKARAAVDDIGSDIPVIADDSGICVHALNNMPGILSSRWSRDGQNVDLLLWQMRHIPDRHRAAYFTCSVACIMPNESIHTASAIWPGKILHEPAGSKGFGYDPIFLPDGSGVSAASLDPAIKNRISHRYRALRLITSVLKKNSLSS